MRPLMLDFVRAPFPAWPGITVLALGMVAMLAGAQHYQAASALAEEADTRLGQLAHKAKGARQPRHVSAAAAAQTQTELRQARETADFLLLPWGELFAALESAALDEVALLAVEPDPKKREVRISAEAKNSEALFAYLQRLEQVPQLASVHLLRHEVNEDDKQRPVRFTVAAQWKAAS